MEGPIRACRNCGGDRFIQGGAVELTGEAVVERHAALVCHRCGARRDDDYDDDYDGDDGGGYTNHYLCEEDGERWDLDGDSMHDDECPRCGHDIMPYASTDWGNGTVIHH